MIASVFARSDGAQLGYVILGEDHLVKGIRPVILINGMSMRFEDWDAISKPLSKKRTVLLFDHRDIGSSIVATSTHLELSIALMAADAVALIKHLGWKSVDLLGYSMGGFILQQMMIIPDLPFVVKHAILAATATKAPHGDPEFMKLSFGGLSNPPPIKLTPEERKQRAIDTARKMTELGYDKEWLKFPENQELVESKMAEAIVARPSLVIAQQALAVRNSDLRTSLHQVPKTTPVLVIHGKLDRIVSYSESSYIFKHIPHARHAQLPSEEYGHTWFDYFTPQVWMDVIESFLDDRDLVNEGNVKAKL